MPPHEWQTLEALLAKLIARAFAADHPELFHPAPKGGEGGAEAMDEDTDRPERVPEDKARLRQQRPE